MTQTHTFYIDKTSGTFSDTLVAFGWMRVLEELHERQGTPAQTHLRDDGAYFTITCAPIQPETLEHLPDNPLCFGAKNKAQNPENALPEPHPHWDIFRAINPASLPGYNGVLTDWWTVRPAQTSVLQVLFDLFAVTPNPFESAVEAWKKLDKAQGWGIKALSTGQQLYNPDQGKGQNKSKSNGLSVGNLDNFWLVEWLKMVGFYEAGQTRLIQGVKDRKSYVVAPRELTYSEHRDIFAAFASSMRVSVTSIKGDAMAALRYTEALLTYFAEPVRRVTLGKRGSLKKRLVAGLHAVFYKDLGNAVATMNIAFIGLPGWIEVRAPDDIPTYQIIVQELVKLVTLEAFFRFTRAFPAYYMGMRERNKYVFALQESTVERIIIMTEPRYAEILEDEGFRNIAYAIRQSTVIAQYQKGQGSRKYDVRYGLGQELARHSRYKDEFIAKLSEFLFKYNAENAQVMEVTKGQRPPYRRSIQMTDIESIVALIDRFKPETIANLLIAYGYARTPRRDGDADTPEVASEPDNA